MQGRMVCERLQRIKFTLCGQPHGRNNSLAGEKIPLSIPFINSVVGFDFNLFGATDAVIAEASKNFKQNYVCQVPPSPPPGTIPAPLPGTIIPTTGPVPTPPITVAPITFPNPLPPIVTPIVDP